MNDLVKNPHRIARWIVVFACAATMLLLFAAEGQACPNCKDAVAEEPERLQQGYVLSIFLMMGTPFAIMLGWAFSIYRLCRQRAQTAIG